MSRIIMNESAAPMIEWMQVQVLAGVAAVVEAGVVVEVGVVEAAAGVVEAAAGVVEAGVVEAAAVVKAATGVVQLVVSPLVR